MGNKEKERRHTIVCMAFERGVDLPWVTYTNIGKHFAQYNDNLICWKNIPKTQQGFLWWVKEIDLHISDILPIPPEKDMWLGTIMDSNYGHNGGEF